jgi:hypothetical protein
MSLMFNDPDKYFELLDQLAKEEQDFQKSSLNSIRSAKDDELLAALKWVGLTLSEIRRNKGYTLKKFVMEEFKEDSQIAYKISNIERGLQVPTSEIFYKYINLLRKENNQINNE